MRKKKLRLDKPSGKFATNPLESYGSTIQRVDAHMLLTPMSKDNSTAYTPVLMERITENSPVWLGETPQRIYVAILEGDEITLTDTYVGTPKAK